MFTLSLSLAPAPTAPHSFACSGAIVTTNRTSTFNAGLGGTYMSRRHSGGITAYEGGRVDSHGQRSIYFYLIEEEVDRTEGNERERTREEA